MKNDKKTKGFKLLDIARDGKGISKNAADPGYGLKGFFISYKDGFNKILYANIFMVLGNFPILFLIAAFSGFSQLDAYIPMRDLFQNLSGFFATEPHSPFSMVLYAVEGMQSQVLVPTTWTYVMYGVGALTCLIFGCVNVGTAYILRNLAMHEPVFAWSDFWYAVKRNWRQALPFGIIDILIHAVLAFNIYSMLASHTGFFTDLFFWSNIVILLVYFVMRYYIYIQMVTFKLSIMKILKNSFIFVLVGLKRNVVAFIGIVLCIFLEIALVFGLGGALLPLAVAAPIAVLFSTMSYMKVYAAYYKIKTVMIDPYKEEHPDEFGEEEEVEVIMRDDVTEAERLAEIKKRNGLI